MTNSAFGPGVGRRSFLKLGVGAWVGAGVVGAAVGTAVGAAVGPEGAGVADGSVELTAPPIGRDGQLSQNPFAVATQSHVHAHVPVTGSNVPPLQAAVAAAPGAG